MIERTTLKDAERIVRIVMVTILITAGISKFFSHGGFLAYYSNLFQGNLRIQIPHISLISICKSYRLLKLGLAVHFSVIGINCLQCMAGLHSC